MTHIHDPEALWSSRFEIRRAYAAIQRLRQADPTVRDLLNRLDELCTELTVEIESIQPEMRLRDIRVISVVPPDVRAVEIEAPVRVVL